MLTLRCLKKHPRKHNNFVETQHFELEGVIWNASRAGLNR